MSQIATETADDVRALGHLFVQITNTSKDGFFVIRETRFQSGRHGFFLGRAEWHVKACRPNGKLVAVKAATRVAACAQLLAALTKENP